MLLTRRLQSCVNNSCALHYRSSATTRATVE